MTPIQKLIKHFESYADSIPMSDEKGAISDMVETLKEALPEEKRYLQSVSAEKDKEIAELKKFNQGLHDTLQARINVGVKEFEELQAKDARINELVKDNMALQYNMAEAERFRPEHESQLLDPLQKEVERLNLIIKEMYGGKEYVDNWEEFKKLNNL